MSSEPGPQPPQGTTPREAQCCICGAGAPMPEMLGLALFPMSDVDAAQQWFAHPECAKQVLRPEVTQHLREELAAVWPPDLDPHE